LREREGESSGGRGRSLEYPEGISLAVEGMSIGHDRVIEFVEMKV
jgi:hypothetical protein